MTRKLSPGKGQGRDRCVRGEAREIRRGTGAARARGDLRFHPFRGAGAGYSFRDGESFCSGVVTSCYAPLLTADSVWFIYIYIPLFISCVKRLEEIVNIQSAFFFLCVHTRFCL